MRSRRCIGLILAGVMATSALARAQEQPNAEELNRKYQDALTQLKAAQDRKNQLATENEALTAKVADLEKQLDDAKRRNAESAAQTFIWRSHNAAWEAFLKRYPTLLERWKTYLSSSMLAVPSELPEYANPLDPLPAN